MYVDITVEARVPPEDDGLPIGVFEVRDEHEALTKAQNAKEALIAFGYQPVSVSTVPLPDSMIEEFLAAPRAQWVPTDETSG